MLVLIADFQSADAQTMQTKFDVPAMIEAHLIVDEYLIDPEDPYEQLIEVVVPVSCWVDQRYRDNIDEFRFDIYWHRGQYPIADYSPRTLLQSPLNGTIAIEKRDDQTLRVGGDAIVPTPVTSVGTRLEKSAVSGQITRFEEIPKHDLLVASGSVNRGTGVFFRFHSAKQFSLEGGRELSLVYRVPKSWRGGILRVDCLGLGKIKRFGGYSEDLRSNVSFIVPTYLKGDRQAQQASIAYVQQEQTLRQNWAQYVAAIPAPTIKESLQRSFSRKTIAEEELPKDWALQIIHSGSDSELDDSTNRLPRDLQETVKQFAIARRQVIAMGN